MKRRDFLRAAVTGPFLAAVPRQLLAQGSPGAPSSRSWNSGALRHLLPTVSDTQMLIKASFDRPLARPPVLRRMIRKLSP